MKIYIFSVISVISAISVRDILCIRFYPCHPCPQKFSVFFVVPDPEPGIRKLEIELRKQHSGGF